MANVAQASGSIFTVGVVDKEDLAEVAAQLTRVATAATAAQATWIKPILLTRSHAVTYIQLIVHTSLYKRFFISPLYLGSCSCRLPCRAQECKT
jgi:hypothetical protein